MKLFKGLFLATLTLIMVISQSCKEDDVTIANPKVKVETDNAFVQAGEMITISISANSDVNTELSTIKVSSKRVGSATKVELDTTVSKTTFSYDLDYMVPVDAVDKDKIDIEVIATDDGGRTTTEILTLTVSRAFDLIKNPNEPDSTFKVWNILGTKPGAFSLDLLANLTINDTDPKDMVDQTSTASQFSRAWASEDGAMYVRDNNFDFEHATSGSAQAAYDAGSPSSTITSLEADNIIIVKMAEPGAGLAVVKIIEVKETPSDNFDYVSFIIMK